MARPKKVEAVTEPTATVCYACKHYLRTALTTVRDPVAQHQCRHDDAPVTGFVLGLKECYKINPKGECPWYAEPETS